MDTNHIPTDKFALTALALGVALFFEVHLAIWWVSESSSYSSLLLLLLMGAIVIGVLYSISRLGIKAVLIYSVGRQSVQKESKSGELGIYDWGWWKKILVWYTILLVVVLAVILILISL